MKNLTFGIDISSKTLDICFKKENSIEHFKINNTPKDIRDFFCKYSKNKVVIAMENTGRYNWSLYDVLTEFEYEIYVINPLHLSKSQGLTRGKDDKTDAYRIALFIDKHKDELDAWKPCSTNIKKLKILLTERNARIKSKKRLLKQKSDYTKMKALGLNDCLTNWNLQQTKQLNQQIEKLIQNIICEDLELKKQMDLMLSIPGVGKVMAWTFLVKTEAFNKITEPRKMACYAGVVPFEHQSGTSIYRKPRVSLFADKQVKSILHLAAMSAIRNENDLQKFYLKKVKQGKNKMLVLNAVRNKIIHIIFAIIKSEKKYQNRLVLS